MTTPALIPSPARLAVRDSAPFVLSAATPLRVADPDLRRAAASALRTATGLALDDGERIDEADGRGIDAPSIVIEITGAGVSPEGYTLDVAADGIRIAAPSAAGAFAGIQTLAQLAVAGLEIPALAIEDAPRFEYRGAMLDVARHFFPVEVVERLVERLAALKINHLHLHLTDDQGWRIEVPGRPALTGIGAATQVGGSAGGFYSVEDYRRIVRHAERHFVTIVPEIDMPGHTHAALVAYPELAPEGIVTEPYTGTDVGFSTLDTRKEETFAFVDSIIAFLAAETPGPFLHIGGDEARSTERAEFEAFLARATRLVAAHGKTPIVWHEAGACADLAPGTIGQYWGRSDAPDEDADPIRSIVDQGGRMIASPADAVYLDIKPTPDHPIGLTWSAPSISLEQAYAWEPAALLPGIPEDAVAGVEAPLWTETVETEADIEGMLFPRMFAVAERAWAVDAPEWPTFARRVDALRPLLDRLGVRPGPAGQGIAAHPVDGDPATPAPLPA
ncbi:family 20 glycosylhydrolase [uncultured Microbacterium sp.]|uniref:family 20 glycosylhydrolase n=1 Tax=uncultured Microbacterium sp. TaxID=191216 RepID=UPI0025F268D3|nr:family 20 glycosylhydrolase [uncultured Microbacterium sp.]